MADNWPNAHWNLQCEVPELEAPHGEASSVVAFYFVLASIL